MYVFNALLYFSENFAMLRNNTIEFVIKDFIFPCHYYVYGFNSAIFRFVDVAYDSLWIVGNGLFGLLGFQMCHQRCPRQSPIS